MARRNDDGVICRVVVNGIDVHPVAARTGPHDVSELVALILFGQLLGRQGLAGLACVDIETHRTLIKDLENVVAVGIENVKEAPFVNDVTVLIDFDDDVAHRAHVLAVSADVIRGCNTHEVVPVLHRVHSVGEVVVAVRESAVKDLAAHKVVLHVSLAVAPGKGAVLILTEPHHDAGTVDVVVVVDRRRLHVPADFALGVIDRV